MKSTIESVTIATFDTYLSVFVHRTNGSCRHYQIHGYGKRPYGLLLERSQRMQAAIIKQANDRKTSQLVWESEDGGPDEIANGERIYY